MFKPPYAEDRTYGGVRGSGGAKASHSLLDCLLYDLGMFLIALTKKLCKGFEVLLSLHKAKMGEKQTNWYANSCRNNDEENGIYLLLED